MSETELFHWIGISFDPVTLGLVPNMNLAKEGQLCTLAINIQTTNCTLWLRKKLKSFLMNNITFYFRNTITTKNFAWQTLEKLLTISAIKFVACCQEFKRFHCSTAKKSHDYFMLVDQVLTKSLYVVIKSFFKYLVCNLRNSVFCKDDFAQFFQFCLKTFVLHFKSHSNEFSQMIKIMEAKMLKVKTNGIMFVMD